MTMKTRRSGTSVFLLFCVIVSSLWTIATSACDSFANKCQIAVGDAIYGGRGRNGKTYEPIILGQNQAYYVSVQCRQGGNFAYLDMTILFGMLEMFVAKDREPTPSSYDFTSLDSIFSNQVHWAYTDCGVVNILIRSPKGKSIFVGFPTVVGNQLASAALPGTTRLLALNPDSPQTFVSPVACGGASNAIVTMLVGGPLTFEVTPPQQGAIVSPDGFVSYTIPTVTQNQNTRVNVYDKNATIATLLIKEQTGTDTCAAHIANGGAQRDKVSAQQQQFYVFHVPSDIQGTVSISLEPTSGDADLYVNPSSAGFYHRENAVNGARPTWASQRPNGIDLVTIPHTDPNYIRSDAAYYITVHGFTDAEFVLRVIAGNVVSSLQDGNSATNRLRRGEYHYYRYFDTHPTEQIWLDLQPTGGDADIFVGCTIDARGDDNGFPSKLPGHYNMSSTSYLEDTLVIAPTDPHSCHKNGDTRAIYYIAVYAYSDCTYTLSALHESGTTKLIPEVPFTGMVYRRLGRKFSLHVGNEAKDLTIQLMPIYGDCDLFVKMNGVADMQNYDFYSIRAGSIMDMVEISETAICTNCWIGITVFGYETSRFNLLAHFVDATVTLSYGMPIRASVEYRDIQYYAYHNAVNGTSTVVATLTVFSGETPSLYLSDVVEMPNATTPHTVQRRYDSTAGTVPILSLPHVAQGSTVYVGVHGAQGNSSYTVRVHSVGERPNALPPILSLIEGIPQAEAIAAQDPTPWKYYGIQAQAGHETINLRVLELVGNVDLFVRKCTRPTLSSCAEHSLPNNTNYQYSTVDVDNDVLKIHRQDNAVSFYIVGAYSTSMYAAFQLSYGFETSILELQAGVAVSDHVFTRETDYFAFYLDRSDKILKITLSTLSGDPDVYVSTSTRYPSQSNSTWKSYRFGSDVIEIDVENDALACSHCTYYIAVFGSSESTYSVMASLETSYFFLRDGVPMSGTVRMGVWNYYVYDNIHGSARDFRVVLSSTSGNADLYITLDGTDPAWNNYAYHSANWLTDDQLTIRHSDSSYRPCITEDGTSCRIIVGVLGSAFTSSYTITMTSSAATSLIELGRTQTGMVAAGEYAFYRLALSEQGHSSLYTLRITVTPTTGHVGVFASCQYPMPKRNTSAWQLAPVWLDKSLDISSFAVTQAGCLRSTSTIYFSVYGYYSAASFSVRAQIVGNSSIALLSPSQSATSTVQSGDIDYYYIRPENNYEDIMLTLSVIRGDVDVYVGHSWEARPVLVNGRMTSFDLHSSAVGDDILTVRHTYVQEHCERISECYFVIAVYASYGSAGSNTPSTYFLAESLRDSMSTLMNGVPQRGRINSGDTDYYRFTLMQPDVDVIVAVSALSGDPDIYVSMAPIFHPSAGNTTWATSAIGSDSLTLQYTETKKHCVPNPAVGKGCDFYIGVFGWRNSSYAISATINDGFQSPTLLLDQLPASGSVEQNGYQYFQYLVSVEPPGPHARSEPLSIEFVLTPTGGSDIDLYMTVAPNASVAREPGRDTFDYRSASWSNIVERIEFTYKMPLYCFNCIIYLAAYGYTAGSFTLQATSNGIMTLQEGVPVGGAIRKNEFDYYTFYNSDPFAEITVTLTSITGDADLYITRRTKNDANLRLPSKTNYIWRSLYYGSDSVNIHYDDDKFCTECEYIVGVSGFSNATFTLMITAQHATVIRLRPNRPQNAALDTGELMYFSSELPSSTSAVTISLTLLSTGYVNMYVRLVNTTEFLKGHPVMPDPTDYRTYTYSTESSTDNHIYIPGPRPLEDAVALITVVALTSVRFSAMLSSAEHPVLLLLGVPQSHYVSTGGNALFALYPDPFDDVRVTVTARTGDPDIFISSNRYPPVCKMGQYSWDTRCTNVTWSSRSYSTDQIIISRDNPCTRVLSSTIVDPSCNPETAFISGSTQPLYVTVYGYSASKFTITGSAVGQHSQLVPGHPQLSTTAPGYICSERSSTTGACLPRSRVNKKVQVAYFSFQVSGGQSQTNVNHLGVTSDVILTVAPSCNHTSPTWLSSYVAGEDPQTVQCSPGCGCAPLKVYITSCPISRCSDIDRKPSEISNQHQAVMLVNPSIGSTLFISSSDQKASAAYCNPTTTNEDCMYFVAVTHDLVDESAVFTITARTPEDISLIPCDTRDYPDRIRVQTLDYIAPAHSLRSQQRFYELCSFPMSDDTEEARRRRLLSLPPPQVSVGVADTLIVDMEQCHGQTTLYACADDGRCAEALPSLSSFGYYADRSKFCIHSWDPHGRDQCVRNPPSSNKITMRLPEFEGNYFLMANGTGRYTLQVRSTVRGLDMAPYIAYAGIQDRQQGLIQVTAVTGNTMTLSWRQGKVYLPGMTDTVFAEGMVYRLYIFDDNLANLYVRRENVALDAACGVDYLAQRLPVDAVSIIPNVPVPMAQRGHDLMSYTVRGLKVGTAYRFAVVALCDSSCLGLLTKQNTSPRMKLSCNGGANECRTQSLSYLPTSMTTASVPDQPQSNDDVTHDTSTSATGAVVIVGIILLVFVIVAIIVAGAYWWKQHRVLSGQDDGSESFITRVFERTVEIFTGFYNQITGTATADRPGIPLPTSSAHSMDESWGAGSRSSGNNSGASSTHGAGIYRPPTSSSSSSSTAASVLSTVQSWGSSVRSTVQSLSTSALPKKQDAVARETGGQSYLPLQVLRNQNTSQSASSSSSVVQNPLQSSQRANQQFTLDDEDDDVVHVSL